MSEIALRLQDVHVAYGNSQQSVLSGFSMSVRKGEIACLLALQVAEKPPCYAQLPDLNG